MKRFCILLLLASLLLSACAAVGDAPTMNDDLDNNTQENDIVDNGNNSENPGNVGNSDGETEDQPDDEENVFIPPEIHPDTVGFYIPAEDGTRARKRITEFSSKRTAKKDIDCFEILATREDLLKGSSFSNIWTTAWDSHDNNQGAKIGFIIEFSLSGGKNVRQQILIPSDTGSFFEYLEVYMYDDIHQTPGAWYTHLEDSDVKEETIISSIKLTAGSRIAEVGDILLSAFIYQGENSFDEKGEYVGEVLETIRISAK